MCELVGSQSSGYFHLDSELTGYGGYGLWWVSAAITWSVDGGWWVVQTADMVLCNVSSSCRESEDKCNGNIMRDIY